MTRFITRPVVRVVHAACNSLRLPNPDAGAMLKPLRRSVLMDRTKRTAAGCAMLCAAVLGSCVGYVAQDSAVGATAYDRDTADRSPVNGERVDADAAGGMVGPASDGAVSSASPSGSGGVGTPPGGPLTVNPPTPHVVGDCSALPEKGSWESIRPPDVTETCAVAIDPFDSAIVWVTSNRGLFKSIDCGAHWEFVSTGSNSDRLVSSGLWSIAIDPVDRGTIYLVGGYGALGLWKSTNGGVDWDDLVPSEYRSVQQYGFVGTISMDPTNHLHLIFNTHGDCSAPYGPSCEGETFDGGTTWKLTSSPAPWGEGGGVMLLNQTSWIWNAPFGGVWLTQDNGRTYDHVLDGYGGGGPTPAPFVPASDGALYLSSIGGMLRSADLGKTWERINGERTVGFAVGNSHIYAADQWSNRFTVANIAKPKEWTTLQAVPGATDTQGAPFVVYDADHQLLYTSMWPAGLWRMVVDDPK
jgi:hypothetical protein